MKTPNPSENGFAGIQCEKKGFVSFMSCLYIHISIQILELNFQSKQIRVDVGNKEGQ